MKTATVRELRNNFGRVSKWLEAGEPVQILKRGRPYARVVPEPQRKSFFGSTPSPFPVPEDIDEPVDITWDAEQ